jgi:hypothetical protein
MDPRRIVTLGADPALSTALAALGAEVTAIRPNEAEVSGVNLSTFASAETGPLPTRNGGLRTTVRNPLSHAWTHPHESPPGTLSRSPFKPKLALQEMLASSTRMRFRTSEDGLYRMPTELVQVATRRIYEIEPEPGAEVNPAAIRALGHAQVILLGPGPFFSSILATLAAPRMAAALVRSRATILFFANHVSEGATTEGMALPCYVRVLREHMQRWTGTELRQMTVVAHGERATWSAIDSRTRLRRVPLQTGSEQTWLSLAEATDEFVSGVLPKRAEVPIQAGALYTPSKLFARR